MSTWETILAGLASVAAAIGIPAGFMFKTIERVERRSQTRDVDIERRVDKKFDRFIEASDKRQTEHSESMRAQHDATVQLAENVGKLTGMIEAWQQKENNR